MPTIRTEQIYFRGNDHQQSTDAQLQITEYNDSDRLRRALQRLGLMWLLALGSLPIMLAHWVLVPGFLIAGPYLAIKVYGSKESLDHASGQCPSCDKPIKIKLEAGEKIPKWTYCPACSQSLHIAR